MFPARPDAAFTGVADIWRVDLDQPRSLLLSESERERAARFHFEQDRKHWAHSRSALRLVLSRYLELLPLEVDFAFTAHGKPALTGHSIEFNLSHSGSWSLIAVSQSAPVGVDIERVRQDVDMVRLLRRIGEDVSCVTNRGPQEFFQIWCRREARTKAEGAPLMQRPSESTHSVDLEAPPGYAAALAMVGGTPELRYRGEL